MNNIGFDNWNSQEINDQSLSSSEAGSPPPTYIPSSSRGSGRQRDDYSFDSSRDENDLEYSPSISAKWSPRGGQSGLKAERAVYHDMGPSADRAPAYSYEKKDLPARRMSTDERMKEILSRNQASSLATSSTAANMQVACLFLIATAFVVLLADAHV